MNRLERISQMQRNLDKDLKLWERGDLSAEDILKEHLVVLLPVVGGMQLVLTDFLLGSSRDTQKLRELHSMLEVLDEVARSANLREVAAGIRRAAEDMWGLARSLKDIEGFIPRLEKHAVKIRKDLFD